MHLSRETTPSPALTPPQSPLPTSPLLRKSQTQTVRPHKQTPQSTSMLNILPVDLLYLLLHTTATTTSFQTFLSLTSTTKTLRQTYLHHQIGLLRATLMVRVGDEAFDLVMEIARKEVGIMEWKDDESGSDGEDGGGEDGGMNLDEDGKVGKVESEEFMGATGEIIRDEEGERDRPKGEEEKDIVDNDEKDGNSGDKQAEEVDEEDEDDEIYELRCRILDYLFPRLPHLPPSTPPETSLLLITHLRALQISHSIIFFARQLRIRQFLWYRRLEEEDPYLTGTRTGFWSSTYRGTRDVNGGEEIVPIEESIWMKGVCLYILQGDSRNLSDNNNGEGDEMDPQEIFYSTTSPIPLSAPDIRTIIARWVHLRFWHEWPTFVEENKDLVKRVGKFLNLSPVASIASNDSQEEWDSDDDGEDESAYDPHGMFLLSHLYSFGGWRCAIWLLGISMGKKGMEQLEVWEKEARRWDKDKVVQESSGGTFLRKEELWMEGCFREWCEVAIADNDEEEKDGGEETGKNEEREKSQKEHGEAKEGICGDGAASGHY